MNKTARVMMVLTAAGLCVGLASVSGAQTKDKWRVGTQSYSFNRFTFEEAMAKTKACGMKYIEVYPDQKVSAKFGDTVFKNMTPAQREEVKRMLRDNGLTLT
jgi:sugar phosphate isomerase/epimerase